MNTSAFLLAGLALAFGANTVLASTAVDETRSIPADGRVQVENVAGSIDITAWDRNEVHVSGELGDSVEKLEIDQSAQGVTIRVRNRANRRYVSETRLQLQVPAGASVIAEGVSADIEAAGLDGGQLDFKTVSGDIEVDARVPRIDVESVSGDVTFRGHTARATVETVSGEIDVRGVEGEVQLTTVSGDVELEGGGFTTARFETVSGDLDLVLAVGQGGRLNVDSMSGDVSVALPSDQQGGFSAQTYSGDIRSDFGSADQRSRGPGSSLDHREGTGGAIIEIESFSGDIRLTRR